MDRGREFNFNFRIQEIRRQGELNDFPDAFLALGFSLVCLLVSVFILADDKSPCQR